MKTMGFKIECNLQFTMPQSISDSALLVSLIKSICGIAQVLMDVLPRCSLDHS